MENIDKIDGLLKIIDAQGSFQESIRLYNHFDTKYENINARRKKELDQIGKIHIYERYKVEAWDKYASVCANKIYESLRY